MSCLLSCELCTFSVILPALFLTWLFFSASALVSRLLTLSWTFVVGIWYLKVSPYASTWPHLFLYLWQIPVNHHRHQDSDSTNFFSVTKPFKAYIYKGLFVCWLSAELQSKTILLWHLAVLSASKRCWGRLVFGIQAAVNKGRFRHVSNLCHGNSRFVIGELDGRKREWLSLSHGSLLGRTLRPQQRLSV